MDATMTLHSTTGRRRVREDADAVDASIRPVLRGVAGAAFLVGAALLLVGAAAMPLRSAPDVWPGGAVTTVRVQPGETLTAIAARIDGGSASRATLRAIRELNGMESSDLVAGAVLRVPGGDDASTALASR